MYTVGFFLFAMLRLSSVKTARFKLYCPSQEKQVLGRMPWFLQGTGLDLHFPPTESFGPPDHFLGDREPERPLLRSAGAPHFDARQAAGGAGVQCRQRDSEGSPGGA